MEEKRLGKRQEEVLDRFYKEVFSWKYEFWMKAEIVAETIFVVIGFGLSTYQDAAERGWDLSYPLILGFQGIVWYLAPYLNLAKDSKESRRLWKQLKYMPISAGRVKKYCFKKLLKFVLICYLIAQVFQLWIAYADHHQILWGNVWYPFLCVFLLPMGIGAFFILVKKI